MGNSRGGRRGVRVYMCTPVVFKHESWKAQSQFILKTDITEIVLCWNFRDGGSLRQVDYFILSGSKHQNKKEVRGELRNYFNTDLSDSKPNHVSRSHRRRKVDRNIAGTARSYGDALQVISVSSLWIMINCSF